MKRENVRQARNTTVAYRRGKRVEVRKLLLTPRHMADADLRKVLLIRARVAAEAAEVPFDLKPEDLVIPHKCPVSGARLQRTIDTTWGNGMVVVPVKSEDGYVPGNVVILAQWTLAHLNWTTEQCSAWLEKAGNSRGMRWHHYLAVCFWTGALRDWLREGRDLEDARSDTLAET
ncbi:hypothetical protein [Variovorax sp. JS1663]|uniref:hypothetical protein n=1 Tax=Variovorax sp. JS1663 TaxID=1851577 RepID=UPI000B341F0F|nr:hypothetical protein [Variovorax sp. JS1663]OUL98769.1 hypothetical protein A8M77_29955 [Variovorax sp. JS1663]